MDVLCGLLENVRPALEQWVYDWLWYLQQLLADGLYDLAARVAPPSYQRVWRMPFYQPNFYAPVYPKDFLY